MAATVVASHVGRSAVAARMWGGEAAAAASVWEAARCNGEARGGGAGEGR